MNVKVTADSTCDLSPALLARYDITLAPLTVIKDGTSYADGLTITPQEIFSHVAAGGSLCSTAAVSVGEYQALFSRFARSCDGLVHITIGSGFSACYQNACLAAAGFPNVRVVDSRNLSTGQGHVVLEACRLRDQAEPGRALPGAGAAHREGGSQLPFEPAGLYGQGRPLLHRGGPGGQPFEPEALH